MALCRILYSLVVSEETDPERFRWSPGASSFIHSFISALKLSPTRVLAPLQGTEDSGRADFVPTHRQHTGASTAFEGVTEGQYLTQIL